MKKNRIRVTEQDLHNIVRESVRKILVNEGMFGNNPFFGEKWYKPSTWKNDDEKQKIVDDWTQKDMEMEREIENAPNVSNSIFGITSEEVKNFYYNELYYPFIYNMNYSGLSWSIKDLFTYIYKTLESYERNSRKLGYDATALLSYLQSGMTDLSREMHKILMDDSKQELIAKIKKLMHFGEMVIEGLKGSHGVTYNRMRGSDGRTKRRLGI